MAWYMPIPVADKLRSHLVCGWTADIDQSHSVVPDGCVDLVWTSTGTLTVCGPERAGWTIRLPQGTEAVGVRFRPGVAHSLLKVNMAELRDRRVPLADLVGNRQAADLASRLEGESSDRARGHRLLTDIADWLCHADTDDRFAQGVASCLGKRSWDVAQLAGETALTPRQFQRRCVAAFGYGPATLRAILRLQRFMALAERAPACTLTELAHRCGFSDQAHLNRESRRISGLTPSVFVQTQHNVAGYVGRTLPDGPGVDSDPAATWTAAAQGMQALLDDPATAQLEFTGMSGPTTVESTVDQFLCPDLIVHGWDIARATGGEERIDPDEVPRILAQAQALGDALRMPGGFGPAVTPPRGADAQDQLLAFLGRQP